MKGPFVLALRRGIIYEGNGHHFMRAIHPAPTITEAKCNFYKNEQGGSSQSLIFREDSFDPVSRIRRGRFYHVAETLYPPVKNVHNYPFGELIGIMNNFDAEAWYRPMGPQHVSAWSSPARCHVVLGEGNFQTTWRAVNAEMISSGDLLWTLKAVSTLGTLPALQEPITSKTGEVIEAGHVQAAIDKLADALHVQQAVPIVDVCRETAKVILTAWQGPQAVTKDLANIIKAIPVDEHRKDSMAGLAAKIINRLHPRGKSAEQEKRELRQVIDEDAEVSVHLIGLLLREIGWAKA